jgi:phage tail protein X
MPSPRLCQVIQLPEGHASGRVNVHGDTIDPNSGAICWHLYPGNQGIVQHVFPLHVPRAANWYQAPSGESLRYAVLQCAGSGEDDPEVRRGIAETTEVGAVGAWLPEPR